MLTSAVNHGFGPASGWVSKVLGSGWAWLAAGYCAALLGTSWRAAAQRCAGFLLCAVCAYYACDAAAGVYTFAPLADPGGPVQFDLLALVMDVVVYTLLAVLASAGLGLVVVVIRRGRALGVLATIVVPGSIAVSALRLHHRISAPSVHADPQLLAVSANDSKPRPVGRGLRV